MKRYDQISSLFWLFIAILICLASIKLSIGSLRDPGPGFLPIGSAIILGLLSVLNYLKSRLSKIKEVREPFFSKERWKKLILVLVALIAYAMCWNILGFLISTFCTLILLLRGIEPQRWIVVIGESALASVALYVLFDLLLKVQLPKGILGF